MKTNWNAIAKKVSKQTVLVKGQYEQDGCFCVIGCLVTARLRKKLQANTSMYNSIVVSVPALAYLEKRYGLSCDDASTLQLRNDDFEETDESSYNRRNFMLDVVKEMEARSLTNP